MWKGEPRASAADAGKTSRRLRPGQKSVSRVIVGCSELASCAGSALRSKGVGDLFVVRVAGNVINGAGSTVKGSIEYAIAELGVQLIMVLGPQRMRGGQSGDRAH